MVRKNQRKDFLRKYSRSKEKYLILKMKGAKAPFLFYALFIFYNKLKNINA